jgi:CheY-like chemotaxis protein
MLVAEDDPNDIFLLERALARSGLAIEARFFRDGAETLDYLHGNGPFTDRKTYPLPRLLLLDIKMPRKNGFEVLQSVRSNPALKRLIAVMFSSSAEEKDINRAYDLGANAYVVKPSDSARLVLVLRRIHDFWFLTSQASPGLGSGLQAT